MARLKNNRRRNRLLSRSLMGVLIVVCALFVIYAFNPLGNTEAAETDASQASGNAADTSGDWVGTDAKPEKPAPPTASTTPPAPKVALPTANAPKAAFLKDAQTLVDNGKLLEARVILNDALQSGTLPITTADEVKAKMRDLNQAIVFTPTARFKDDPFQGDYTVQSGDLLGKISVPLNVPYAFLERINAVNANRIRAGQSLKTIKGPIHATVSKKRFTMDLYLGALPGQPGSMYLTTVKVGLGADSSTPTGTWEVTRGSKLVNPEWTNPRTSEVFKADDPKNPLGERWIGLTGIAGDAVGQPSYGIHGTIEPGTIGTNASMGCIRLLHDDVEQVYDMLVEGKSTVLIME